VAWLVAWRIRNVAKWLAETARLWPKYFISKEMASCRKAWLISSAQWQMAKREEIK